SPHRRPVSSRLYVGILPQPRQFCSQNCAFPSRFLRISLFVAHTCSCAQVWHPACERTRRAYTRIPGCYGDRSELRSRANAIGTVWVARLCGAYPQRRLCRVRGGEENSLLIQLGTAKSHGGVEPVVVSTDARRQGGTAGQKVSFPLRIQTGSAKTEDLARPAAEGTRQQNLGASVDPLYLFSRGALWHQQRDASAGWDLIQFLRSPDREIRAMAAS